jgi:hypothetical protein
VPISGRQRQEAKGVGHDHDADSVAILVTYVSPAEVFAPAIHPAGLANAAHGLIEVA